MSGAASVLKSVPSITDQSPVLSHANPIQTLNQGLEFSTGAFAVGSGASASQVPATIAGLNSVAIIACGALIAAALFFRGRKLKSPGSHGVKNWRRG
jgi:hypothetical protein